MVNNLESFLKNSQQHKDTVRDDRNFSEENHSEQNISLKVACTEHQGTFIQEACKTRYEKTEQLNTDRHSKKLWNLVTALNNGKPWSSTIILEQEGKLCTGKQVANILIKQ